MPVQLSHLPTGASAPLSFAGLQEYCSVGSVVEVVINAVDGQPVVATPADVDVQAIAPNGTQHECDVTRTSGAFVATFTPNEIGEWRVAIRYGGRHIRGSPFPCHIFDAAAVQVHGLDVGLVGQELAFTVDASRAGRGDVKVHISRNGVPLDCRVEERPAGVYRAHFTPDGAGQYQIHVTFNGCDVKGSPFVLDIADATAVSVHGDQLRMAAVGRLAAFFINAGADVDSKDISVIVTGPSRREKHARVIPLDMSTFKAEFKPIEAGEHRIDVLVHDTRIADSPFVCNVGDPDLVTVKRMPEAIETRNLNAVHSFEIDATAAGSGNLEIIINGGRIACRVWETAPRRFQAQFTPTQPVRHTVEMKFNGEHVLHSPWQLPFRGAGGSTVSPRRSSPRALSPLQQRAVSPLSALAPNEYYSELVGQGLRRAAVGQVSSFEIKSDSLKIGNVIIRLFDSDGRELDVKIIEKSHSLRCEYTVQKVGEYRLEVYINGRLIDSGPLFISGYDAGRIRVAPFGDFLVGQPVNFTVDAVEAGKGQLEISVNQGRVPNNVQMQDAGRCLVTFIPQHSGTYVIDVTFNGQQVHGCPIKVDVQTKQVGKPVSAPVYSQTAGGAGVSGMTPPPGRGSSAMDRGPSSSAYFSASPHVDTTYSSMSYGASPSPYDTAPRSPPLVAHVQQRSTDVAGDGSPTAAEHLRSPRLVQSIGANAGAAAPPATDAAPVGYTVAQYGADDPLTARPPPSQRRLEKYFEKVEQSSHLPPRSETAQFEMTRSTEMTLVRSSAAQTRQAAFADPAESVASSEDVGKILDSGKTYKRFESVGADYTPPNEGLVESPAPPALRRFGDDTDAEYAAACAVADSVADAAAAGARGQYRDTRPLSRHIYDEIPAVDRTHRTHDLAYTPLDLPAARQMDAGSGGQSGGVEYTHVVEPHTSNIEALTPSTRRKLLEHSVFKAADLKETERETLSPEQMMQQSGRGGDDLHEVRSEPSSKHSSKPTTPRLSLKFGRDKTGGSGKDLSSAARGFDFGKSKITSKNEVVRRGKDVEVKVESLKLSKDDQLKVVVMAPARKGQPVPGEAIAPPEVPHKVKKSRNTYEISFRPTEVGTHKVLLFVNNQFPHPQTPFPIRVYDASEIIVGEIVRESAVNDTVEFTVDAGRAGFGNLEMAIKDSDQCIIPSHVSQLEAGTAKFLVTFSPTSLGVHTVNITFNKEVIKGSPFEVNVVETLGGGYGENIGGSSTLDIKGREKTKDKKDKKKDRSSSTKSGGSGSSSKRDQQQVHRESAAGATTPRSLVVSKIPSLSRVGRPAELVVTLPPPTDASQRQANRLEARVFDSEKDPIPCDILDDADNPNSRCVQFIPLKVGDHEIELRLDGAEVSGSPFTCRAYDPTRIVVSPIPDAVVDVPVHFTVDAAAAGVGNLEVAVNDGKIPSMAHALGQHKYDISFTPREVVDHYVSVRFNNERVPGSPFLCRLVEAGSSHFAVGGPGLERVAIDQPADFWVTVPEGETNTSMELPEVTIVDPRGETLNARVTRNAQDPSKFTVVYTPRTVGNHQVNVRCGGEPLTGSPFTSKAFDANAARLILAEGGAVVGRPCTFTIDAAKAGAGNMEIIVSVGKRNVPNFVTSEGQAKFKVSFTPQEANDHIISVKFNGIPIPGSPMRCAVSSTGSAQSPRSAASPTPAAQHDDAGELRLAGDLATAAVGHLKRFSVDAPPSVARNAECDVIVSGPIRGQHVPVTVRRVGSGFDAQFTPTEPGNYLIEIKLNGKSLEVCPIICKATYADENAESEIESRHTGEIVGEEAASAEAGGSSATCDVRITRFPRRALVERVSEFELDVMRGAEKGLRVDVLDPKGQPLKVDLRRVDGVERRDAPTSPSWQHFSARWEPRREGRHAVRVHLDGERLTAGELFAPTRAASDPYDGDELDSTQRRSTSPADSLHVDVLDLSAVRVIDLHENAKCGETLEFQLDWSTSGGRDLRVEARHEEARRVVPCETAQLKRGLSACSFKPPLAGRYLIDIYVDELKLPECPYECMVRSRVESRAAPSGGSVANTAAAFRVQGNALQTARRGHVAAFSVFCDRAVHPPHGDLDVVISDARHGPLPVRCYKQHDGSYTVEFTPEQIGTHKIEITFAEVPLAGSPFSCEVVDPTRVTIRGIAEPLPARAVANIIVNRVNAGTGDLALDLRDAQGAPLKLNRVRSASGEDTFTFLPTKLGPYSLNATLGGYPLPGMPRTLIVEEPSRPCVYGAALDYACVVGQQASMIFDAKRANGGLKIEVRAEDERGVVSSGAKLRHTTDKRPDGTTEIAFRPTRVGVYRVAVDFNNNPVSGSPFRVCVVDPERVTLKSDAIGDASAGDGMLHLRTGATSVVDVDATEAGPGSLRVEVRGASPTARINAPDTFTEDVTVRVHDVGFGKWRVEATPARNATPQRLYKFYFYWAELVVPNAYPLAAIIDGDQTPPPLPSTAQPTTPKPARTYKAIERHEYTNGHDTPSPATEAPMASRIHIDGEGASTATLKEPTEFFINASSSKSPVDIDKFDALLTGERADIPVRITTASRPNVFRCMYTPLVAGRYELSVRYMDEHIRGSPNTVDVRGYTTVAELIKVDSKSLKIGIIGEDVKTVIDARQAKAGHLSAQCVGPSQLEYCELFDNRDGTYILRVTPKELGKHTLTIKYANEHVPGSPFTFNVSNPPDPSQVRVYGPGVEHGILHSYKSNFIVETKGAGAGQLTVRVRGPKGAFNVEMQRDHQQDRTIHCKYEPREPGDYQVEVKWHGQHVPGSPFLVIIVDTEEELQRFLAGGAPSPQPTTPFVPPGWLPPGIGRGPPPPHMLPAPPPHMLGGPPPHMLPSPPHHHHPHAMPHPIYGSRPSPRAHRY